MDLESMFEPGSSLQPFLKTRDLCLELLQVQNR